MGLTIVSLDLFFFGLTRGLTCIFSKSGLIFDLITYCWYKKQE